MISKLLKSNRAIALVFIILFALGLWFLSILHPIGMGLHSDNFSMPFARWINRILITNSRISVVVSFALVLTQSLLLVQFNKQFIVITQRTYLPAFFYILLTGAFVPLQRANPVVFGLFFIYLSVFLIFSTYRKEFALNKLYMAAFFIGIASLFWAQFAIFFILLIISLIVLRPFVGREWTVCLLGFLTPFLFTFVYYFVFRDNKELLALNTIVQEAFKFIKVLHPIHYAYYIFYGLVLLIIGAASVSALNHFQKKKIMIRKFFTFSWWIFFIYLLAFLLIKNIGYEIVFILSIPISFLLSDYFYAVRKERILSIMIYLLLISAVYIQIIAHF